MEDFALRGSLESMKAALLERKRNGMTHVELLSIHGNSAAQELNAFIKEHFNEPVAVNDDPRIEGEYYPLEDLPDVHGNWLHDNEDIVIASQSICYRYQPNDPDWIDPIK